MGTRRSPLSAVCCCLVLALAVARGSHAGQQEDPKKKAQRVTSYVLLAEAITRVGIQVGAMLDQHPYDPALTRYARDLGRLHAKAIEKLTPPEGAEALHESFKAAVLDFSKAAEAYCAADYTTARRHRDACVRDFTKALAEVAKLKREGAIP